MVATVSYCQLKLDRRGGSYRVNDSFLLGYVVATVSFEYVLTTRICGSYRINGILMAKELPCQYKLSVRNVVFTVSNTCRPTTTW